MKKEKTRKIKEKNQKEKNRAEKAYSYRMVVSFKTSVTYIKNFFNFMPDSCVLYKAAFVGYKSEDV